MTPTKAPRGLCSQPVPGSATPASYVRGVLCMGGWPQRPQKAVVGIVCGVPVRIQFMPGVIFPAAAVSNVESTELGRNPNPELGY